MLFFTSLFESKVGFWKSIKGKGRIPPEDEEEDKILVYGGMDGKIRWYWVGFSVCGKGVSIHSEDVNKFQDFAGSKYINDAENRSFQIY